MEATLILPHQIYKEHPAIAPGRPVYLVEACLFFHQYAFHKQKILFHRATMKYLECHLRKQGYKVHYIEAGDDASDIRVCIQGLLAEGVTSVHVVDPTDDWLERRISKACSGINLVWYENPSFINPREEMRDFFESVKVEQGSLMSFYEAQRIKHGILIQDDEPVGGKWTFDVENRIKYPHDKTPPEVTYPTRSLIYDEALKYVHKRFETHHGRISADLVYPTTHAQAAAWLQEFFIRRFHDFGDYEDAIVKGEGLLHHSLLSPLLNVGLLLPMQVVKAAINYAEQHDIPLNSVEGFVRQIIGWREYNRGVYESKSGLSRTSNFWSHDRPIPTSFYQGTTGILPIDETIHKVLDTAYAHQSERLMILGNFMVLCEFDPIHVHKWFMELFIDSYDWVMVPSIYGMSLYADGGLMSSKPYISSSNYIKKVSNYPDGPWREVWDGLFWRFLSHNREQLSANPRLNMLIRQLDKMPEWQQQAHFVQATNYLKQLDMQSTASVCV